MSARLVFRPVVGNTNEQTVTLHDDRRYPEPIGLISNVKGQWIAQTKDVWTVHETYADAVRRFDVWTDDTPSRRELLVAVVLGLVVIAWVVFG